MSATGSVLSEAELHGLVDGQIDAVGRADVLRRAAASPADRARIEAWQDHAEMICSAFRGVEKEPIPVALNLKPPTRVVTLLPVGSVGSMRPERSPPSPAQSPVRQADASNGRARTMLTAAATALVIGGGLAGAWMIAGSSPVVPRTVASGTVEDVLARRTAGVLVSKGLDPASAAPVGASPGSVAGGAVAMPTTSIPDLTSIGFTLSGAVAETGPPASLVFRYRNAAGEHIVIGVAKAPREWRQGSPDAGTDVVVWRVGGKAYAIGGTLRPERLRAIATSLRDEAIEE